MKIKAKIAFFLDDYTCISCNQIVDLQDKLAKSLINCGYAIAIEEEIEEPVKRKTLTKKKKTEVI